MWKKLSSQLYYLQPPPAFIWVKTSDKSILSCSHQPLSDSLIFRQQRFKEFFKWDDTLKRSLFIFTYTPTQMLAASSYSTMKGNEEG